MAKKLKVELDLDTTRAKQKAREVVETGGDSATGGGAVSTSAEKVAEALDKASRGARNFGDRAEAASSEMGKMGRLFAGMGIGLAQSLVANGGGGGFLGTAAVGAVSAGMMGYSAGGKKGGAAAALASIGVTYFENKMKDLESQIEKSRQTMANLDSIRTWNEARERTLAFRETLESLSNVEDPLTDRQRRLAEEIKKREEADKDLFAQLVRSARGDGAEFGRNQNLRNVNAAELDALNALMKDLGKSHGAATSVRESTTAPDALSRVGGAFADSPGGSDLRSLLDTSREQLRTLKSIESKKERETAWQ